jgi:uncharacterized protein (DUF362 family)/Pyruvate/2-oxoacid:ferredoxin oxidoreductase delta subunit
VLTNKEIAKVFVQKASYNYDALRPIVFNMIDSVKPDIIKSQDRVLVKPNLLLPAEPRHAVLTHPHVVRMVAEYVLDKGARPVIADSPAHGDFKKIFEMGGYKEALSGLDVECREFKKTVPVDIGEPFGMIDIAKEAIESDVVINLPKLKTHARMLMTLGIENLFGCIVGLKKSEWYLKVGMDRALFAKLLVRIYQEVRPALTMVDGVLAMEGQGPGKRGTPRSLGMLVAGDNAAAIDVVICNMLGINPEELSTNKEAIRSGEVDNSLHVSGDINITTDFDFPETGNGMYGPRPFHGFIRKHMMQRPVCDQKTCKSCGSCREICPGKAISAGRDSLFFDYDKCIRCYCCIEVCPHGAISATEPLPGRLIKSLADVYS